MVYNETSRVSKTVSSLLPFSRKSKPEFKPVDLNTLLEETLSLTEYQMRLQGITVEAHWAPDLLPVMADQGQMKQVFLNLLLNAQDAMPQGGILTLVTRNTRRQKVMVVSLRHRGGHPQGKVFPDLRTVLYHQKGGSGVGLGLSVVQGIIRDHKGIIKVDSVVGQGTSLPSVCPPINRGKNMLPHKKINILVVDDELSIRESLSGWLQQDGYEVETAADGWRPWPKSRRNIMISCSSTSKCLRWTASRCSRN